MTPTNFDAARQFADFGLIDRDAGNRESASGPGSSRSAAENTIKLLRHTIETRKVRTILDLGCGDWNWMKDVGLHDLADGNRVRYQGWDASPKLVEELSATFGVPGAIEFHLRDITTAPIPKVDLIIARDVLFHLPRAITKTLLDRISEACDYFLSTSFLSVAENGDISAYNEIEGWGYYNINLNIPPFNLARRMETAEREKLDEKIANPRYICLYNFSEGTDGECRVSTGVSSETSRIVRAPEILQSRTPQISVVVPCYNCENDLPRLISSLCEQSFEDFELILLDDCSTDRTGGLLLQTGEKDKRIRPYLGESNLGPSARRNQGVARAQGNYVLFADSDDRLPPGALEVLWSIAQNDRADVVRGSHMLMGRDGSLQVNTLEHYHQPEARRVYYGDLPSLTQMYSSWNMLISRNLLHRTGLKFRSDLRIGEDRIFNQQLFNAAFGISLTKQVTYIWNRGREAGAHLSMTSDSEARFASIAAFVDVVDALPHASDRHRARVRHSMIYEAANCLEVAIHQQIAPEVIDAFKSWIRAQPVELAELADMTIKGRSERLIALLERELGIIVPSPSILP